MSQPVTDRSNPSRLRIAILAAPMVALPPAGYAGTERIVAILAQGLHERGHAVTVFATGDSDLPCEIVPVVERALWRSGHSGDQTAYIQLAVAMAWRQADRFDIIHSHIDVPAFPLARYGPTPVVTTLHGRLDVGGTSDLIDEFSEIPLVAISDSQRRWNPGANWVSTIHHGLDFSATPQVSKAGEYLAVVGRLTPEKGIAEAIEVARRTGRRLVMAAKVHEPNEREMFEELVAPAVAEGIVDWRGELDGDARDAMLSGALATLMLGAWPEPFGLVAIESMATGTPVIARRAGGCTETIEHGLTGYLVDDVSEAVLAVGRVANLKRDRIAAYSRERFSSERMVTEYEAAYARVLGERRVALPDVPLITDASPAPLIALNANGNGRRSRPPQRASTPLVGTVGGSG
ncbi:MAG TPA: glycosyltransferase family 4 protein [Candidatus Limnocylindrales bacterium]|nr:glycosyltransferase family 4 protein [Candidatus Limnocylindrales bacterium]